MAKKELPEGCKRGGPGPIYHLPTTVGFEGHDITRDRKPAFSIGSRLSERCKNVGPGPSILVEKYDRFGSTATPAFSIAAPFPPAKHIPTPGPDTYYPELPRDAPAYSLKSRLPLPESKSKGPGPNAYMLPSSLNGKIEYLGQRLDKTEKDCSPGPAKYYAVTPYKGPMFSFGVRGNPPKHSNMPGPATYLPPINTYRSAPMYSFGLKHSECKGIALTDADKHPECEDISAK